MRFLVALGAAAVLVGTVGCSPSDGSAGTAEQDTLALITRGLPGATFSAPEQGADGAWTSSASLPVSPDSGRAVFSWANTYGSASWPASCQAARFAGDDTLWTTPCPPTEAPVVMRATGGLYGDNAVVLEVSAPVGGRVGLRVMVS